MGVAKYSPTVSASYNADQGWWNRHCKYEGDLYDRDGYDEYGYNLSGRDRAGYTEEDYGPDEDGEYRLWERVHADWVGKIIS